MEFFIKFLRFSADALPNLANGTEWQAVVNSDIRDLKQTERQRDDDGYSHNDIPDLVQKK
jgi:hypothetical protein